MTVVYSLYTETRDNLIELVSRYFPGATLYNATGLYEGITEPATEIRILAIDLDLQRIVHLAGDIKQVNSQSCVIVTWQSVNRLDV